LAQETKGPISQEEFIRLLYQLPKSPGMKAELISEIRRRGIGFELTNGIRSIVATKSGNDAELRRTLEEAARRKANPTASALPPAAEGREVLARSRAATLEAAEKMPDFVVKQLITRSYARGATRNWTVADRLTIAVSYRAGAGEQYKLLAVNGLPTGQEEQESNSYEKVGGTSSTGEYVSMLKALFAEETKADFKMVDTDLLRGRRAIVYEFVVKLENSRQTIKAAAMGAGDQVITVGYRGRVWIDRENYRVLRMEEVATDIPADFPVSAASSTIDYDWVTISEQQYLLPTRAIIELTASRGPLAYQTRNDIRFRNYQKYGSEVRIIDDVDEMELPEDKEKKPQPLEDKEKKPQEER
jgi:hypothetical protein